MLEDLLRKRDERVRGRWLDAVLAAYSPEAHDAWSRQRDPFANPVGHHLRVALDAVLDAVLEGRADGLRDGLTEVLRIRAVQRMSPAEAVGFVFLLKQVIRTELEEAGLSIPSPHELSLLDARIDRAALVAFDLYVEHRERLSEIRICELKKNIPWVVTRAAGSAGGRRAPAPSPGEVTG